MHFETEKERSSRLERKILDGENFVFWKIFSKAAGVEKPPSLAFFTR